MAIVRFDAIQAMEEVATRTIGYSDRSRGILGSRQPFSLCYLFHVRDEKWTNCGLESKGIYLVTGCTEKIIPLLSTLLTLCKQACMSKTEALNFQPSACYH
jgi:hypothetical protein